MQIPVPLPLPPPPIGVPEPQPVFPTVPAYPGVQTAPSPSPSVSTNPPNSGSIWGVFADLFHFGLDWRYIVALIFLLLTVNLVEGWQPEYVWPYVAILLMGVVLTTGRFGPELKRLLGG